MRFYKQQHQFYCGIDLHVKTMQSASEMGSARHRGANPPRSHSCEPTNANNDKREEAVRESPPLYFADRQLTHA